MMISRAIDGGLGAQKERGTLASDAVGRQDDRSTDASAELLRELAARAASFRVITPATNRGYGPAIPLGFALVSFPLCARSGRSRREQVSGVGIADDGASGNR